MIRLALVHVAPFISLYMFTMMFEEIRVCMAQGHEQQQEARHHHEQQQQGQSMIIMCMGYSTRQKMIIFMKQEQSTIGRDRVRPRPT